MTDKTNTLIVGGGQAGLAVSAHLQKCGVKHLIIEKDRIAERWRTARWDSLVMNGPAWHDRFPDKRFDNWHPDSFPNKNAVANYFETFAKQKHFQTHQLDSLLAEHRISPDFVIDKWNDQPIFHKLTHQHLEINFWIVKLSDSSNLVTQSSNIQDYPMPKVLQNFRDKFFIN